MGEVDTVFYIKQVYSTLAINQPWLSHRNIVDPTSFLKAINPNSYYHTKSRGKTLRQILDASFEAAADPRKSGRMNQYKWHEELLLDSLLNETQVVHTNFGANNPRPLTRPLPKIPIFVEGLTVTGFGRSEKEGVDPYSNSNLATTLLIEHAFANYNQEFLDRFSFWTVQPITYVSHFVSKPKIAGDAENEAHGIEEMLIGDLQPVWRGSLQKFDDVSPKKGSSRYNAQLLDASSFECRHISPEELQTAGVGTKDEFIELKKIEAYLNQQILALKLATIFDLLQPQFAKIRETYEIPGYPLFMAKTSASAKIMEQAVKYAKQNTPLQPIGGKLGIHSDNDKPLLGICEPMAMGRLFGFFQSIYEQHGKKAISYVSTQSEKNPVQKVRFATNEKYPFLLIEQELPQHEETIVDVFEDHLTAEQRMLVGDFAYMHRVGFSAIQPRIVSLLTRDRSIYYGLRWRDKRNSRWLLELEDKEIIYPSSITNLMPFSVGSKKPIDIRGSEFTLPTNISLDKNTLDDVESGNLHDFGCSLNKLIGSLPRKESLKLLLEQLAISPPEIVEEYYRHQNPKSHESYAATRGVAIHKLAHYSDSQFAHNRTLELAGLKPVASREFAEIQFDFPWTTSSGEITLFATPDVALFMKKSSSSYDALIMDTKTNRVTSYPEHKYTMQTFYYGWFLRELVKATNSLQIDNVYTVLNKQAFYRGFNGDVTLPSAHEEYRTQQFSPITRFSSDDLMFDLMPQLINGIVSEKKQLFSDAKAVIDYKKKQSKCGRCDNCYLQHSLVCDRLKFMAEAGAPVNKLLEGSVSTLDDKTNVVTSGIDARVLA